MRTATRLPPVAAVAGFPLALLALVLCACGKESLAATMAGTYATDAVQADLEEHEKAVFSDDFHAGFDKVDKAEAAEAGTAWARLRLHTDGRFEYEGPASSDGSPDAKLRGKWTARAGFVDLTVEKRSGEGADDVPATVACPATARAVEIPFAGSLRLARR